MGGGWQEVRRAAGLVNHSEGLWSTRLIPSAQDDVCPFARERDGDGAADVACGAGDERRLPIESCTHCILRIDQVVAELSFPSTLFWLALTERPVRRRETRLRGADDTTSEEREPCNGLTRKKS